MTVNRIREARERRGLSQSELAEILGVSQRSVGSWERGEKISGMGMRKLRNFFGSELEESATVQATVAVASSDQAVVAVAKQLAIAQEEIATLRDRLSRMDLRDLAKYLLEHPDDDHELVSHLSQLRTQMGTNHPDLQRTLERARYERQEHLREVLSVLPPSTERLTGLT